MMSSNKKILFVNGWARNTWRWALTAEVIKRCIAENNEVYYLDCNSKIPGWCWLNKRHHWGYCKKCSGVCKHLLELMDFPKENILKMEKVKPPKFPILKSTKEVLEYEYDGMQLGISPASCCMTMSKDYDFSLKKWGKVIQKMFETEYIALKNIERLDEEYNFDEFWTFNGRVPLNWAPIMYAKKHNKTFVTHEGGGTVNRVWIIKNNIPQDYQTEKNILSDCWAREDSNKREIAKNWFEERRMGKDQFQVSFTKGQTKNLLPAGFDKTKENIVFFNSSTDEIASYKCWEHPFAKSENEVIEKVLEHYKDDTSKKFYLRIHPNLTKAKKDNTTQIREIREISKRYKNLIVIEPDEKIDTYALIDTANKVITAYSTIGVETTYWGSVSIVAGKVIHDDLDIAYIVKSFEELFNLIDTKDLKPKPPGNTMQYGYAMQTNGDLYKYVDFNSLSDCKFLGCDLSSYKSVWRKNAE